MLDSEPDNNATTTPDEAPKRPRRRAASRPAGPPKPVSEAADTPPTEGPQDPQPQLPAPDNLDDLNNASSGDPSHSDTSDTEPAPAKKASARKSTAKKTATKKAAAKKAAPRKTAAKKATAEVPADESALTAEQPADGETAAPAEGGEQPPAKRAAARKTAAKKTATKAPAKRTTRKTTETTAVAEPAEAVETGETIGSADLTTGVEPAGDQTPAQAEAIQPIEDSETVEQAAPAEPAGAAQPAEAEEPAADAEQPAEPDISIEAAIASAMNATLAERGHGSRAETAQVAESAALEAEAPDRPVADSTEHATTDAATTEAATTEDPDAEPEDAESAEDSESHEEGGGRRRRRRRGGRRRRRGRDRDGSGDDDSEDSENAAEEPAEESADESSEVRTAGTDEDAADTDGQHEDAEASDDESDGESGDGQRRRRRRRRRRRGEDTGGAPDDPSEVVVRVREPRKASDEVTGIDGSTRMEAKRQRRREGREAGRRRAPIISEAEFLARRESVNRKMIIRQRDDLAQIAVLEDGILVEHYVDRESANSLIGNVYLGRVQNVLPSMEAAFIDIGRGRNAVLYAGELDWDSYGAEGHDRKVENVLKSGQTVLVQVTKDPVGAKGARLTNHVSIPGRYVVYAPGGHLSGISRKLPENERKRLKDILDAAVDDTASVIVRTAAEGASEDELTRDVNRLKAQWEDIERKVKSGNAPQLLYAEPDLTLRIVRDLFTEDFSELIVQGNGSMNDTYDALEAYMQHVAPHLADRIKRWDSDKDGDLFGSYRLDEQIAKGLERKVFLPSGGSLIIDRTEAMTVIDVNTGKFTGSGGNLEATITSNNLEAAEEIVRQLRLRDIGGIIVIDFIDMVLPSNRELLLRRLVECLGRDRTRHQVAEVTSLGLVQMTRKRIGTGLLEAFSTECPTCHGRGVELHDVPVADAKLADGGAREDNNSRSGRRRGGKGRKGGDNKSDNKSDNKNEHKGEHKNEHGGEHTGDKAPEHSAAGVPAGS